MKLVVQLSASGRFPGHGASYSPAIAGRASPHHTQPRPPDVLLHSLQLGEIPRLGVYQTASCNDFLFQEAAQHLQRPAARSSIDHHTLF